MQFLVGERLGTEMSVTASRAARRFAARLRRNTCQGSGVRPTARTSSPVTVLPIPHQPDQGINGSRSVVQTLLTSPPGKEPYRARHR